MYSQHNIGNSLFIIVSHPSTNDSLNSVIYTEASFVNAYWWRPFRRNTA